jgi:hypothetical protein
MLLQASAALPTVIRDAIPSDFKALAKLYTSALANNESWQIIGREVKPEVAQEWLWDGVAGDRTSSRIDTIWVLERLDTNEVIGVIWFNEAKEEKKNEFWRVMLEGCNKEELKKLVVPIMRWYTELLQKHSDYISE